MFITRVKVHNFRSLVNAEVELGAYTALVGLNDSGKSNFLRALNLFFTGHTDLGSPLVFARDFSQNAKVVGKKARQIEIQVEFSPPKNYADQGPIIWRKVYRADSPLAVEGDVYKKDGTGFSRGSRAEYWVRHIAFEYVPAIRGKPFFAILKRRLYSTLASTVAPKLTAASSAFLSDLRREVRRIEAESERLLNLKTEFSLPTDLGELFEALDFDAADDHAKTALQLRGDGIQGRHVPLILKFLADQRKANSAKGKPPSETVWGFEEPENNLELIKQVEVASEFRDYSDSVQILASTHSPAFYGEAQKNGRVAVAARQAGITTFSQGICHSTLDESLGLMSFVQPYLGKAIAERDELIDAVKLLKEEALVSDRAAIYVEGESDQIILEAARRAAGITQKFEIVSKAGLDAGANWVVSCCVARAAMTDLRNKTAALFDDDDAGCAGRAKLASQCDAIGREKIKSFLVAKSNGNDEVRQLKKAGFSIAFGIEEVCGKEAWDHAEAKGWLVDRGIELIARNAHLMAPDKTFVAMIEEKLPEVHVRRLVQKRVDEMKKKAFAKHVANRLDNGMPMPPSLEVLINEIAGYFG